MVAMVLAQVGPLTTITEALATAVGAGVVLCSVAAGLRNLARGMARADIEGDALGAGYVGGGVGALLACFDVLLRYI